MRRSGEVVSKDTLMFQLYADAELRETHTIDVLMGRLRRKMQLENQPDAIQTVRGQAIALTCRHEDPARFVTATLYRWHSGRIATDFHAVCGAGSRRPKHDAVALYQPMDGARY